MKLKLAHMGTLVVLVGLLGLAGTGWAADDCNYDIQDSQGHVIGRTLASCGGYTVSVGDGQEIDPCLAQMEAAMRAMDKFVSPNHRVDSYDGCNHCSEIGCTALACQQDSSTHLRRLEWEVDQAKKQVEHEKQRNDALRQWTDTKQACWREP